MLLLLGPLVTRDAMKQVRGLKDGVRPFESKVFFLFLTSIVAMVLLGGLFLILFHFPDKMFFVFSNFFDVIFIF